LPANSIQNSDSVIVGSLVTLNFTGTFLDGKIFDSTHARNQPLEIVYGKPLQIIKGLEIALKGMKKGEKAKIIIPSQLAFGSSGSPEIIPPFTTLIYDIEIVNIKN
jgi:FKBP-type peptidyl-prolyl cis-trans isomerase